MVVIMPPCAGLPLILGCGHGILTKRKTSIHRIYNTDQDVVSNFHFLSNNTFARFEVFVHIHYTRPKVSCWRQWSLPPLSPYQNGREVVKKSQCHRAWLNIHPSDWPVPSVLCLSWCTFGRKVMMMALNLLLLMMAVSIWNVMRK